MPAPLSPSSRKATRCLTRSSQLTRHRLKLSPRSLKSKYVPVFAPKPTRLTNGWFGEKQLSAATIIPIWIVLSSSVIIYNNYLYNTLNFKFPVFLVTFHLFFAVNYFIMSVGFLGLIYACLGCWNACIAAYYELVGRCEGCPNDS